MVRRVRATGARVVVLGRTPKPRMDVPPWLCTTSACAAMVGSLLAYRDDNHLTTTYTTWLSPLLGAELDETVHGARRAS